MSESEDPLSSSRSPRPLLQAVAFATIYLVWGSTYLAIRIGVQSMPPLLMAGARFLLAGASLFAIARALGVPLPDRRQWLRAAFAGIVMLAVGNGLVTLAEQEVPSNFAALLVAAVPLWVALIDWLRPGGSRPTAHVVLGIVVGAAGMVLLVVPDTAAIARPSFVGIAAILVSGLAWAAGSLYARYSPRPAHPLMASAHQMLAGGGVLLTLGLVRGEANARAIAGITSAGVWAFAYLTVFGSLVAFSAFGWLVRTSTPARLSTTAFVNPLVAVVLGRLVLGETLTARAFLGAGLIVSAVIVMTFGGALRAWSALVLRAIGWSAETPRVHS